MGEVTLDAKKLNKDRFRPHHQSTTSLPMQSTSSLPSTRELLLNDLQALQQALSDPDLDLDSKETKLAISYVGAAVGAVLPNLRRKPSESGEKSVGAEVSVPASTADPEYNKRTGQPRKHYAEWDGTTTG